MTHTTTQSIPHTSSHKQINTFTQTAQTVRRTMRDTTTHTRPTTLTQTTTHMQSNALTQTTTHTMAQPTFWHTGLSHKALTWLIALICVIACSVAGAIQPAKAYADPAHNTFTIALINSNGTGYDIAPVDIPYEDNQTVRQALEASEYGFEFGGDGFIISVNNTLTPQLTGYYTGGWRDGVGYAFPAKECRALIFNNNIAAPRLTERHCDLLEQMGLYLSATNNVRNYAPATAAYLNAYKELPLAEEARAADLYTTLKNAMDEYESIVSGVKYSVNFTVTRAGSSFSGASIVLTDSYGNETVATQGSAEVVAGTYTAEVGTPDGLYATQKTFTVNSTNDGQTIQVDVPSANWYNTIDFFDNKSGTKIKLPQSGTIASRSLTFYVPDYIGQLNNLYVNPAASSAINPAEDSSYVIYALYNNVATGGLYENRLAFSSLSHGLPYLLNPGSDGAALLFEIRHECDENTVEIERLNATVVRTPSLKHLSVKADGAEILSNFSAWKVEDGSFVRTYDIQTTSSSIDVTPTLFIEDNASVTVDGTAVTSGSALTVPVAMGTTSIAVVAAFENGQTTEYRLNVTRANPVSVTLTHEAGVTTQVINEAGGIRLPQNSTATQDTYDLYPSATYQCVGTKDTSYHSTNTFTAEEDVTITVATPKVETWISRIQLKRSTLQEMEPYQTDSETTTSHTFVWNIFDTETSAWLRVTKASSDLDLTYTGTWASQVNGDERTFGTPWNSSGEVLDDGKTPDPNTEHANMTQFITKSANSNTAQFRVTSNLADADGTTYYQDFDFSAHRICSLRFLSAKAEGANLLMTQTNTLGSNEPKTQFDAQVLDYTVDVPVTARALDVSFRFQQPLASQPGLVDNYTATVSDQTFSYDPVAAQEASVPLDPTITTEEVVEVTVSNAEETSLPSTYRIHVVKHPTVTASFDVAPEHATINVIDTSTGARIWPNEAGQYLLTESYTYTWSATAVGYVAQTGTIMAADDMAQHVTLVEAPPNTAIDPSIQAWWPSFRLGEDNLSVVDSPTPKAADMSVLYWAKALGQGYSSGATGCPTLVNGYLYSYGSSAGTGKIYKLDPISGETLAENTMVGTSSFSLTPTTYGDGMIFVALSNGRVEAFNADTLESLWVYSDPLGGQPNCPITYKNGCVYTGFWNAYTNDYANFVCISATDENPAQPGHRVVTSGGSIKTEIVDAKCAMWTHAQEAGYYWAGALARDNFILMGCDDGEADALNMNGVGNLFSFDPTTGRVIDEFHGTETEPFTGDVRTQITFDETTGYYYFMTKNGFLCRIKVADDGTFINNSFSRINLAQASPAGVGQCTSTPAISNGRCYVGVMGNSAFGSYSGHHVAVIDLETFSVAYNIYTKDYVQATPLITSHYLDGAEGYNYVYCIENDSPGKMRIIRDKPGMTSPDEFSLKGETYTDANGDTVKTATVLFTPTGSQAQYAICSPIADEDGFIYFKNDTAFMMCLGPTMTALDVIEPPDRTSYAAGEVFDPTGMKVRATYSNGITRDVTQYVSYSTEALTTADTTMRITFPYTMYQNTDEGTDPDTIHYNAPATALSITVSDDVVPLVLTHNLDDARVGEKYSFALRASAAPPVSSWQLVSGSTLPKGLTLDSQTGVITGTPQEPGLYQFSVTATNSIGTCAPQTISVAVNLQPTITYPVLPADRMITGTVGDSFRMQAKATGYPNPVWGIEAGQLPEGLTLDSQTGVIAGRFTAEGVYHVSLNAKTVGSYAVSQPLTFTVLGLDVFAITTDTLPEGEIYNSYGPETLTTNGTLTPTWSIVAGALPQGISLNSATGTIEGEPLQGGQFDFTVEAQTDIARATKELSLAIKCAPVIVTGDLPVAHKDRLYRATIETSGYPAATLSATGLPAGLTLDKATGRITGQPTQEGAYDVRITASNGVGDVATAQYTLEVTPLVAAQIERLAGDNRYETMAAIVNEGFETCEYAVVAAGENFPDALAASSLAGVYHCPVILTDSAQLSNQAKEILQTLGVTKVFVVGGENSVSPAAFESITALNIETTRIAGGTRQKTSVAVMDEVMKVSAADTVIIAAGKNFPDSLAIGPWAFKQGAPIVLTNDDGLLGEGERAAILEQTHLCHAVIVGGENSVSEEVLNQLAHCEDVIRLAGDNRYATSVAIAKWELENGLFASVVGVATGANYPDALAGAAFCGAQEGILVLAQDDNPLAIDEVITPNKAAIENCCLLGGPSSVSEWVEHRCQTILDL